MVDEVELEVLELVEVDELVEVLLLLVELEVLEELVVEDEVEVEVLVLEVDELVELEVLVQVKPEFPNKNSLMLAIFCYYNSRASTLCPSIKGHIVLYRENLELRTTYRIPVFYSGSVVKG